MAWLILRRVVGESMLPSLRPGQLVVGIRTGKPSVGSVVIVLHDGLEKVKRIKQMDGDKVFLIGDNPQVSTDSRHFGWVGSCEIIALVVWPS